MSPLRFGNAEIRFAERQLLVDGRPAVIGARAFDVLHQLIAHRERVVGKGELLRSVWPGLVVEENNLQVQVSTLRKLLGADAITTVPGQGYQFTAPLDGQRDAAPETARQRNGSDARAARDATSVGATPAPTRPRGQRLRPRAWLALAAALLVTCGIGGWAALRAVPPTAHAAPAEARNATPPPHSVAVLPFVNMSGDPKQDYFSDGLAEELLNSLSTIPDLQVAARTSSFSFRGKETEVTEIGRKLNVGAVLEGSVREDGDHVRIAAQLINAGTGFLLWSQTYDRDRRDILKLQTEIASAVTWALQATLLPNVATAIELGGTEDPLAFDAYLRGERIRGHSDESSTLEQVAAFDEAIRREPGFAKAYVSKASALDMLGGFADTSAKARKYYADARATAEQAVAMAPALGRAHVVLGSVLAYGYFDFAHALNEIDRALALSPNDPFVLQRSVHPLIYLGRSETAVSNAQRALALDPLNASSHASLGFALYYSHEYQKAIEAFNRVLSIDPRFGEVTAYRGISFERLGDLGAAGQSCNAPPLSLANHLCLAIVYHLQNRTSEAAAQVAEIRRTYGDAAAYQLAEIYARWGDVPNALQWLETAYRLRDPGLVGLREDRFDPIRQEPRFQRIERELKFPS